MAKNLTIGENYISEIELIDSDGNPVDRVDIENLSVQIRQYNRIIETIASGSAKLTAGTTATKLKIQTSSDISAKFREGRVYARAVSEDTNVLYTVDGERISLPDYHILTMFISVPADDETVTEVIDHWRGSYDASDDVAPSTGGSGTGGAILAGDEWVISVEGDIFGTARSVGDRMTALVNSPGQTSGNWSFQNSQP